MKIKKPFKFRKLILIGFTGFTLFASLSGCFLAYPIQSLNHFSRWNVWAHGVERSSWGSFETFERNHCRESSDQNCLCLLMFHGLGDSALTFNKILNEEATAWKTPQHMISLNLPGSGNTPALESSQDYSLDNIIQLIKPHVEKESHCDQWMFVGNSFGGWVATRLAFEMPQRVAGLLLLGSVGVEADFSDVVPFYFDINADSIKKMERRSHARPWTLLPRYFYQKAAAKLNRMPLKELISAQMVRRPFVDKELRSFNPPVGLVWGAQDGISPPLIADRFARNTKNLSFKRIIEDCGHLPQIECPEAVKQALNDMQSEWMRTKKSLQ